MAKEPVTTRDALGDAGEPHQTSAVPLTTNQGVPIADDQNSLRIGARGPTLLEDFHFLEKITHFDHERIPERIVHARGSAAHGTFRPYAIAARYSRAAFLADPAVATPVFARFSTVAGGAGSVDLPRDVRGFATKFYTAEGNFDLVGNNIPVFFVQDALKFPDFVHAVKMEPDRGFPQNGSAHDTFWDFVSLAPETLHTVMWAMSDRALPRSLRMMDGFGVHTFKLVDAAGRATFIKWHWRPSLGTQAVLWDEACKINGADQDFHRRDLWAAIQAGAYPAWELAIQPIPDAMVDTLEFDILDPTKLIPEETIPLVPIGTMVLDRWPDNFFAETEQAAFHPGHLVPGIEFSDDPLLQGRIFSYTDTQLSRLGGPNFHELEINRPRCPMHNFQRDGVARLRVDRGRTSFEPSTLAPDGPRETPTGFATHPQAVSGTKVRQRAATFGDHYSQARMFYQSMTPPEQRHIEAAYAFELAKVETAAIRTRVLGHLAVIDPALEARVADALGMTGQADAITPTVPPRALAPSPALSMLAHAPITFAGRTLGVLIADGFDAEVLARLRAGATQAGAAIALIAPTLGATRDAAGRPAAADHLIAGGPSVLFDAVAIVTGEAGLGGLVASPLARAWVGDAFTHCKVIGTTATAAPLLAAARATPDAGVVDLAGDGVEAFFAAARRGRIWSREGHPTAPTASRAPGPPAAGR